MEKRWAYILGIAITVILIVISAGIPFHWDTVYHSMLAQHFFMQGYQNLLPPADLSNGNPTLYPVLLALSWKVLGKSLIASHLFFAVIMMFTVIGFIRLGALFLSPRYLVIALFLLFLEPGFLAQNLLMGYDILLLGLTLWGLRAALKGRWFLVMLFSILLALTHIRGILAASLFVVVAFLAEYPDSRARIRILWAMVPSGIALSLWMVFHYSEHGFFLLSDSNNASLKEISFIQWTRNVAYVIWKLLDIGRFSLWVAGAVLLFRFRKQLDQKDRLLLALAIAPVVLHLLVFSGTMFAVSHRYFMLSEAVMIILVARLTIRISIPRQWILVSAIGIVLLSGHLWYYPQRFGNAWDSTLNFLSWQKVETEVRERLKAEGIHHDDVMAGYPLTYRYSDRYLDADTSAFRQYDQSAVVEGSLMLLTNYSNMHDPADFTEAAGWHPEWDFRHGRVYARLLRYHQ